MGRIITCAVIVLVAANGLAVAQDTSTLTLAQAVREALEHNNILVNQRDSITQADLNVRLARNTFRPRVTPNVFGSFGATDVASQTYRVDVSQKLVTGTEFRLSTGTTSALIPSTSSGSAQDLLFYSADTTLTLTQPLLRGFGRTVTRRSLASAELTRQTADRERTLAEQQITIDVAAGYYRLVSQQNLVDVAGQSLLRARRLRDAAEAKLTAGLVSQLDVLRSQQLVSEAETQLFDAQSGVEDARDRLAFLIGRPTTQSLQVAVDIPRVEWEPADATRATAIALGNRLDLTNQMALRADADSRVRVSRNMLLPQVDINLAMTRRETARSFGGSFALDGYRFVTFFTIAMPVDRTAQQVEFQSALLDRERRQRDTATLERQIGDDVRVAVREQGRLARAVIASATSVEIGRKEVEVAELRYQNGLSNNLDVVTAEGALLAAEARRIQSLADAAVGRLRFRALLGILNPRTDLQGATSALPMVAELNP
ncbi:MAG: TolC family protein [Vicinamibacterales bacterium]